MQGENAAATQTYAFDDDDQIYSKGQRTIMESNIKNSMNVESQKKLKKKRGEGADAQKVIKRIKDFDPETSPACQKLNSRFGTGIIHDELKSIAEFICEKLHIELDRDAKRDNRVLHKWFQENWELIEPEIDRIELYDKDHRLIQ